MKKLLAIFAHPDDEGAVAGTLARYTRIGSEVMLVCATRGEAGEISDPALATPETLGIVRTGELQAACDTLGLHHLRFLDYRDSGMAGTPENEDPRALIQADPDEVIGQLVTLMRDWQPDGVITFEPVGWYGHPDHRAVSRWTTAAYERLADPTAYPAAGQPWQPDYLFYAVLPVSHFQTLREHAAAAGLEVGDFAENFPVAELEQIEAQITHTVDVSDLYEIKLAAIESHRTQFGEENWFRLLPETVLREAWRTEYFIQVDPPLPNGAGPARGEFLA